jgi:hypothetical protein
MKRYLFMLIISFGFCPIQAQHGEEYRVVDERVLALSIRNTATLQDIATLVDSQFNGPEEKLRAFFIWMSSSFEYDISQMRGTPGFETKEKKIQKFLSARKGVCEHFALTFHELCRLSEIKSYVIVGYTRQFGRIDSIPHAWCAMRLNDQWRFVDPTWGSGYVKDSVFIRSRNENYFLRSPEVMLRSHMPFDPLWQLVETPIDHEDFKEEKFSPDQVSQPYSVEDSLIAFDSQTETERNMAAIRRIEKAGIANPMIDAYVSYLKKENEIALLNRITADYNQTVRMSNKAVEQFNRYIRFKNKQFKPSVSDSALIAMLDKPTSAIKEVQNKLALIDFSSAQQLNASKKVLEKNNAMLLKRIAEEKPFVDEYVLKNKQERALMFIRKIKRTTAVRK